MKRISCAIVAAAISFGAIGIVHAETKTRAQVRAELQEAKAKGLVTYGEQEYPAPAVYTSGKTSEQVKDELQQDRAAGLITDGEHQYPPKVSVSSSKPSSQVMAEMRRA